MSNIESPSQPYELDAVSAVFDRFVEQLNLSDIKTRPDRPQVLSRCFRIFSDALSRGISPLSIKLSTNGLIIPTIAKNNETCQIRYRGDPQTILQWELIPAKRNPSTSEIFFFQRRMEEAQEPINGEKWFAQVPDLIQAALVLGQSIQMAQVQKSNESRRRIEHALATAGFLVRHVPEVKERFDMFSKDFQTFKKDIIGSQLALCERHLDDASYAPRLLALQNDAEALVRLRTHLFRNGKRAIGDHDRPKYEHALAIEYIIKPKSLADPSHLMYPETSIEKIMTVYNFFISLRKHIEDRGYAFGQLRHQPDIEAPVGAAFEAIGIPRHIGLSYCGSICGQLIDDVLTDPKIFPDPTATIDKTLLSQNDSLRIDLSRQFLLERASPASKPVVESHMANEMAIKIEYLNLAQAKRLPNTSLLEADPTTRKQIFSRLFVQENSVEAKKTSLRLVRWLSLVYNSRTHSFTRSEKTQKELSPREKAIAHDFLSTCISLTRWKNTYVKSLFDQLIIESQLAAFVDEVFGKGTRRDQAERQFKSEIINVVTDAELDGLMTVHRKLSPNPKSIEGYNKIATMAVALALWNLSDTLEADRETIIDTQAMEGVTLSAGQIVSAQLIAHGRSMEKTKQSNLASAVADLLYRGSIEKRIPPIVKEFVGEALNSLYHRDRSAYGQLHESLEKTIRSFS